MPLLTERTAAGTHYAASAGQLRSQGHSTVSTYGAQLSGSHIVAGGEGGTLHTYDIRSCSKLGCYWAAHPHDVFTMHLNAGRLATGALPP